MSAVASCCEFDIPISFFHNADHAIGSFDSTDRLFDNHAAFIQYQRKFDSLFFQIFNGSRSSVTAPLFSTAASDIDIYFRLISFSDQFFDRREDAEKASFGIHRSSSPYSSFFVDVTTERGMFPSSACFYHILVAHKKNRVLTAFSAPFKEQASVKYMLLTVLMHVRK